MANELIISLYIFATLTTLGGSIEWFRLNYPKLALKHHGPQLHLRRGCYVIALIVVNLLSPITFFITCVAFNLIAFYSLAQRQQSSAQPVSGPSNIAGIQHRAILPSSIIEEVTRTIKQDQSTFPCIDTVSQMENDDDTCPICLRRINSLNTNRMNKTEIKLKRALDHDPCLTLCNHVMHFKCLKDWLDLHQTCPICRNKQLMKQCKVFRYDTVESVVRGDVNTGTNNTHKGSSSNDMALPSISSGVTHMSTVIPSIHVVSEATTGTTSQTTSGTISGTTSGTSSGTTSNVTSDVCYSELSVSVDLCDPHGISTSVGWAM